jgi:hypothetical protein
MVKKPTCGITGVLGELISLSARSGSVELAAVQMGELAGHRRGGTYPSYSRFAARREGTSRVFLTGKGSQS